MESLDVDQKVNNAKASRIYLQFYNNLHGVYVETKFEKNRPFYF